MHLEVEGLLVKGAADAILALADPFESRHQVDVHMIGRLAVRVLVPGKGSDWHVLHIIATWGRGGSDGRQALGGNHRRRRARRRGGLGRRAGAWHLELRDVRLKHRLDARALALRHEPVQLGDVLCCGVIGRVRHRRTIRVLDG